MDQPLLEVKNLSKKYKVGKESVDVLKDVSFQLQKGEIAMIIGPSGSGKTTLLNLIGGLDNPDGGSVHFRGKRIDNLPDHRRTELRRNVISLVFQSFELIPVMTCFDNIAYPLRLLKLDGKELRERVERWSARFHVDHLLKRKPNQISMGQKQRIALVRSIVVEPQILLGDEVTANLDRENTKLVLNSMHETAKDKGTGFLLVTHDSTLLSYADHIFSLIDGNLSKTSGGKS